MSKCKCTDEFTIKVLTLLYYIHITTHNITNCNCPCVLVRFYTQSHFRAILSVRISDSGHPVTCVRKFCTKNPSQKHYRWMSVHSIGRHTLLNNPKILHTKTFFLPPCHAAVYLVQVTGRQKKCLRM